MISQHAEQTLVFSVSGFLSLFLKGIARFQDKVPIPSKKVTERSQKIPEPRQWCRAKIDVVFAPERTISGIIAYVNMRLTCHVHDILYI